MSPDIFLLPFLSESRYLSAPRGATGEIGRGERVLIVGKQGVDLMLDELGEAAVSDEGNDLVPFVTPGPSVARG